jgi:hypothetical protein
MQPLVASTRWLSSWQVLPGLLLVLAGLVAVRRRVRKGRQGQPAPG